MVPTRSIDESIRTLQDMSIGRRKSADPAFPTRRVFASDEDTSFATSEDKGNLGASPSMPPPSFAYCRSLGMFMPSTEYLSAANAVAMSKGLISDVNDDEFNMEVLRVEPMASRTSPMVV